MATKRIKLQAVSLCPAHLARTTIPFSLEPDILSRVWIPSVTVFSSVKDVEWKFLKKKHAYVLIGWLETKRLLMLHRKWKYRTDWLKSTKWSPASNAKESQNRIYIESQATWHALWLTRSFDSNDSLRPVYTGDFCRGNSMQFLMRLSCNKFQTCSKPLRYRGDKSHWKKRTWFTRAIFEVATLARQKLHRVAAAKRAFNTVRCKSGGKKPPSTLTFFPLSIWSAVQPFSTQDPSLRHAQKRRALGSSIR